MNESVAKTNEMPELVYETPSDSQPTGWLVIDSTVHGRSHGGLRISLETGEDELRMLARRMTLKFGFLGIANGGAKAGIRANPEAPLQERRAALRKFAESIHELVRSKRYYPHPDMGTTETDIQEAFRISGLERGHTGRQESADYTALGVLAAANVALRMRGKEWAGLTVAVHGFGKVGSAFALLASQRGARIVAVSTSQGALQDSAGLKIDELLRAAKSAGSGFVREFPATRFPADAVLQMPVDLLSPCAGSGSIHAGNASCVQADIICPGANCPITPGALQALQERGILCLPDFLTSAGGVLGGTMAFAGLEPQTIANLMTAYLEPRFSELFHIGWEAAEQHCMNGFLQARQNAERRSIRGTVFQAGLELYRLGWVPRALVRKLAPRYFLSR